MSDRDPALLPGPTAAQVLGRSRLALAAGVAPVLLVLILLALGVAVPVPVVVVVAVAAIAGFVAWLVLGQASIGRMRAEREAGYATAADVAGLALRHPRSGVLERSADEPPADPDDVPLVRRLLSAPSRWTGEGLPGG